MAEEPILCFDGDKAGRKAAYRAMETALPLIGPGKSLRFALLPEGQDPDDLASSGGAEAIAPVIAAAKPFAEMLFLRETEGQIFDTPERRAGAGAAAARTRPPLSATRRCAGITPEWRERLRALFGAAPPRAQGARGAQRGSRAARRGFDQGRASASPASRCRDPACRAAPSASRSARSSSSPR